MPMYELVCLNGHTRDIYAHNTLERACRAIICAECHNDMSLVLSVGRGLTYFAEGGKGKWIHNLGDKPVFVESTRQHEELMKAAGVTWAPARRGMPGSWGG